MRSLIGYLTLTTAPAAAGLFADASVDPVTGTPTTVLGSLLVAFASVLALVGWIVKRMFDKTIPDQQQAFREELAAERKANQEITAKLIDAYQSGFTQLYTALNRQSAVMAAGLRVRALPEGQANDA
jgi:uncharacterized protein HemX